MNNPIQTVDKKRKHACERIISWMYSDSLEIEKNIVREYFFYGDIQMYLAKSNDITDMVAFECTPFINLEDYLANLKIYWEWVLEAPDKNGDLDNLNKSIEERLIWRFGHHSLSSHSLTDEIKRDLFLWCYGKTYDPERVLPMPLGPDNWQPKLNIDVDLICSELAGIVRKYIWGYEGDHEANLNGKYFLEYFLSIYPHMSVECFDLKRCEDRSYEKNGVLVNLRGYQLTNRWLLAGLNNILTYYEEDEEIEELLIHDQEALNYLKDGIKKINMPKEFYELEKFVIEHGEDCLDATID